MSAYSSRDYAREDDESRFESDEEERAPNFFRKFPKTSERFRAHPNVSERMREGPNRSKHVSEPTKTSKNLRKLRENFAKVACVPSLFRSLESIQIIMTLKRLDAGLAPYSPQAKYMRLLVATTTSILTVVLKSKMKLTQM